MNNLKKYLKLYKYFEYIILLAFKKYKGLICVILGLIISIGIEFLSIYIVSRPTESNSINLFNSNINIDTTIIPLVFMSLLLIRFISLFVLESFSVYYAKELQSYFSATALRKILNSSLKKIETKEIGHYSAFAGDEASNAAQIVVSFINIFNNLVLMIAYFTLAILTSIDLLYFILSLLIVIGLFFKQIYKYLFFLGESQVSLRIKSNSVFVDSLNGLRTVKAFSIENYMADQYTTLAYNYFTVNSKIIITSFLSKYLPLVLVLFFFGLYCYFIAENNNPIEIGTIMSSLFILLRLLHSIGIFASILGKSIGELKGTIHLIDFLIEPINRMKKIELNDKINHISFQNVSFSYGSSPIFHNLNISFNKGRSYAIVGQTGSGKSTLLDLIMDFNTPTNGSILINNIQTDELNEKSLANKILYIGQEAIIFNDSIKNNLELGLNFSDANIKKCLELSCLFETILTFPNGLNYQLQYRGTNLSGGQKQRLNIARALLREPDVLILDESVNALDENTRHKIVKNILDEYKDKILIFVTHDKDILGFVNEVIDLDKIKRENVKENF